MLQSDAASNPLPSAGGPSGAGSTPPGEAAPPRPAVRRPIIRQYELVERVKAYDPDADEDLLNRAYVYAMKAHGSQLRASGDPYFHHPVEVAGILAGLKLDSASIATGLLHDTVEDTGTTLGEIERLFGAKVARLVDGVTKLNKIELQSAQSAQAENFRKLLIAMSEDIRVLLVKLADRLHNMRTLHFIKNPDKRRRIAAETMEIYAPLAERIGMEGMKTELGDLAFAELWPDARASIVHRLGQLRRDDDKLIHDIVDELGGLLRGAGIEAEIQGREKTALSIWHKMERKNVSFEQLSDIMAFRVLVGGVAECYAALGVIHSAYSMLPGRFKDFISVPKPNGYRSLHTTIIGPERRKIEVQIRTRQMHEVAELGVAAHWAYKQDSRLTDGRQYRWIRELLDILEHAAGPEEFLENTKLEMFQDQVFCFTPKGSLIALPRGATPIDFAYAVHSEVGDRCVGAKVDGRMVQLRTVLQNGDQVEIITSRNSTPSPEWERFVVTGKARARIRRHVRLQQREEAIEQGREALARAARAERLALTDKLLEKARQQLGHRSTDDLLAALAEGQTTTKQVLEILRAETRGAAEPAPVETPVPRRLRQAAADPDQALVDLPDGVAYSFGGCCHPVPGDPIIGVVRTGRSVVIHLADCPTLKRVDEAAEALVDVAWNGRSAETRAEAKLLITTLDQPGALGTVSAVIGKQGGNITNVRFGQRLPDFFEIYFNIEVGDVQHLQRVQAALRANPMVSTVERVQG